jgi:nitrile hydratase accessory protein
MSTVTERIAADLNSPAAIPRRNGEPVFNEPWESRAFGIAVALCERGLCSWDEFRDQLIAEITASDGCGSHSSYYERFLAALENLLIIKGTCLAAEIEHQMVIAAQLDDGNSS